MSTLSLFTEFVQESLKDTTEASEAANIEISYSNVEAIFDAMYGNGFRPLAKSCLQYGDILVQLANNTDVKTLHAFKTRVMEHAFKYHVKAAVQRIKILPSSPLNTIEGDVSETSIAKGGKVSQPLLPRNGGWLICVLVYAMAALLFQPSNIYYLPLALIVSLIVYFATPFRITEVALKLRVVVYGTAIAINTLYWSTSNKVNNTLFVIFVIITNSFCTLHREQCRILSTDSL